MAKVMKKQTRALRLRVPGVLVAHVGFSGHWMALPCRRTLFIHEPSVPINVMIMARFLFGAL